MKTLIFFLIVFFVAFDNFSQNKPELFADGAISYGKMGTSATIGLKKNYTFGLKKQYNLGYGARLTSYFSENKNLIFRTAPAKITSGKASLAALFSEDIKSQIDTLNFKNLQVNSLNFYLDLGYNLTKKISIGFNIDAVGLSFGAKQQAIFTANDSDFEGLKNNKQSFSAKPTSLNLLLISDSDIGSLNSEIYSKIQLNPKIGIRTGACFQFIEYSAEQNLAFNNNRFRMKQLMPFLALIVKIK